MVSTPPSRRDAPIALDGLIRNAHLAQVRLARPEELNALARAIPETDTSDETLENWRAIFFAANYGEHRFERIHLLGTSWRRGASGKISSPLLAIDLGTRLAATRSGAVYRLIGAHGLGEPPVPQLHLLAGALWAWGHGVALGVALEKSWS